MINKDNGHLEISPQIVLAPNDLLDRVGALKLGEVQELSDMKNGYKWLTLKNVNVNGEYFIIALCFLNEKMRFLNLVVSERRFDLNRTWDAWSELEEERKLIKFRTWVVGQLGREGQFSWGQVSSSYDPKGGQSAILVRYN